MSRSPRQALIDPALLEAVIFDMDGVITDTASVHASAWKEMFDTYLAERARKTGEPFRPFDEEDYLRYVDGRPRYDGVRSFLQSRGVALPEGRPTDAPSAETVCGLGNRKDEMFMERVQRGEVKPFDSSVRLVEKLQSRGIKAAIVSASRNMTQVLDAAGLSTLFPVRVDGLIAAGLGLAGKPDPAMFLEAARRLNVQPPRAAVVEDALAGVEAGRRGSFGLVVGVDRVGQADALREHGADVVVEDLGEVAIG